MKPEEAVKKVAKPGVEPVLLIITPEGFEVYSAFEPSKVVEILEDAAEKLRQTLSAEVH